MTEYKQSINDNKEKDWRNDMTGKADQGKVMVGRLKGMFKDLPRDPWMVRDMWCQAFELLEQILERCPCSKIMMWLAISTQNIAMFSGIPEPREL
jgi:hypothetical protein